MRRRLVLVLGVLAMVGTARGEDGPKGDEVPWPVPKVGARAIHRMHAEMTAETGGAPAEGTGAVRCDLEEAQEVLASVTGGLPDIRMTVGRMRGTVDEKHEDGIHVLTVREDLGEVSDVLRARFAPVPPGARFVSRPGAPPAEPPSDEKTRTQPPPGTSLFDLMLPVAPPPGAVRSGTTWDADVPLGALDRAWGSPRARNVVSAIDATTIAWSTEVDSTASSPSGSGEIRLTVVLHRRISREDGLSVDGSFDILGGAFSGPRADFALRTKGRWERAARAESPPAATEAERALDDLAGKDPAKRAAAASALAANWPYGARAVPVLVEALSDDDAGVRAAATAALSRLAARALDAAVPFLATLAKGEKRGFTEMLAMCLALGAAVTPTDFAAGISAGPLGGPLVAALLASPWGRSAGPVPYASFLPILDGATYRIVDGLEVRDPAVLEMASAALALAALAALPSSAAPATPKTLLDLLRHPDTSVRWAAATLLHRLGSGAPDVLEALRAARAKEPPLPPESERKWNDVSAAPAIDAALAARDPKIAQDELARLRAQVAQSPEPTRWEAAIELSRRGIPDAEVTALLLKAFADKPKQERWVKTVEALGRIGPPARPALETIDRYLARFPAGSPDPYVTAAAAACRIDGATVPRVEVLIASLSKPEPPKDARPSYPGTRSKAEERAYEAARAVVEFLPSMEADLRARATVALGGVLGWAHDSRLRDEVLVGLPRGGTAATGTVPGLLAALEARLHDADDPAPEGTGGGIRSQIVLLKALGAAYEQPWRERFQLVDALGRIGPAAKDALAMLDPLGDSPDPWLRYLAIRATRRIRGP